MAWMMMAWREPLTFNSGLLLHQVDSCLLEPSFLQHSACRFISSPDLMGVTSVCSVDCSLTVLAYDLQRSQTCFIAKCLACKVCQALFVTTFLYSLCSLLVVSC